MYVTDHYRYEYIVALKNGGRLLAVDACTKGNMVLIWWLCPLGRR